MACAENTVIEDDTMAKGSGVVKVKDEDDLEIEALIQRELDALGEEDLLDDGEGLNQQEALGHGSDGNAEVQAENQIGKAKKSLISLLEDLMRNCERESIRK